MSHQHDGPKTLADIYRDYPDAFEELLEDAKDLELDVLAGPMEKAIRNGDRQEAQLLYIIQAANGHVKIGISSRPRGRLKSLSVGSPLDIELVATADVPYPKEIEKSLHERFEKYNVKGEWFDLPEWEMSRLIEQAKLLDGSKKTNKGEPDG